jgi:hypothetical protein
MAGRRERCFRESRLLTMSYFYPVSEYLRPWKLATFAFGVALMIVGAIYTPAPDWDVPISLIMPGITYLTAPCSVSVVVRRQWRLIPVALFFTWFSVDGVYAIYWYLEDPWVLETMRSANAPISLMLYGLCGFIWLYRGSLKDLYSEIRSAVRRHNAR